MRSYKHTTALLQGLVSAAVQGPNEQQEGIMPEDTITGIKVGVLSTVHLMAAALADAHGVPRQDVYKEIGFPLGMPAIQEYGATKIIEDAYARVASDH